MDRLLDRGHPWGSWMARSRSRDVQKAVERTIYAPFHPLLTKKERTWTEGFLTAGRLRARHLDDLLAARGNALWLPFASLTLAPNQGERIPHVAQVVGETPWCRLSHLTVDDPRFVPHLVQHGFPDTLTSIWLWALGGVPADELASALPPRLDTLHVQVFQQLGADDVAPLFARRWTHVEVDLAAPWIRDVAVGNVERLHLHTPSFSLFGTRRSDGFDWVVRRHSDAVEHHLWRFVDRWPPRERDAICPDGSPLPRPY
jgi:hypothetical protein